MFGLRKKIEVKVAEVNRLQKEYEKMNRKEGSIHESRMKLKTLIQEKRKDVERDKMLLKYEGE